MYIHQTTKQAAQLSEILAKRRAEVSRYIGYSRILSTRQKHLIVTFDHVDAELAYKCIDLPLNAHIKLDRPKKGFPLRISPKSKPPIHKEGETEGAHQKLAAARRPAQVRNPLRLRHILPIQGFTSFPHQ